MSLGDTGRCGLVGRGTPVAWHGSGRGPRQGSRLWPAAWDGFGIFRGIQLGFASRRSLAVPHETSMPHLRRLSALRSGEGGEGAGWRGFGVSWRFGALRACGHGSRRGPRGWGWVRDFDVVMSPCCTFPRIPAVPPGASMPRPRRYPALCSGWWRWGAGCLGCLGGSGRCGLVGRGAPVAWQGNGRGHGRGAGGGPWLGGGLGIFRGIMPGWRLSAHPCDPPGTSTLRLWRFPAVPSALPERALARTAVPPL